MGETDFLYADNSVMHKYATKAGWMQKDQKREKDWKWDEHGRVYVRSDFFIKPKKNKSINSSSV